VCFYVSVGFACSILGLPSQGSKKTLGQKLLGMLPSENSSKKTDDQNNPQEVFKMLTELEINALQWEIEFDQNRFKNIYSKCYLQESHFRSKNTNRLKLKGWKKTPYE